ncbi:MAG TPA: metalloregulator ArsR/SmtB family transcription factor [Aggregatilineales bacterium]|nr:metalloregulator ArsR/SmtB family transcription factor [Aggregatilineales bacterium]
MPATHIEIDSPPTTDSCQSPRIILGDATHIAEMFKALSHPVRVQILDMISQGGGELCACNIEQHFDLTQPTISHHFKVLREAGLIESENRGVWVHHRVNQPALDKLQTWLKGI